MLEEIKILEILNEWKKLWKKKILEREISEKIINATKSTKEIIDIIGVRRSGKSSLLGLIIQKLKLNDELVLYINFEEPAFLNYYNLELLEQILEIYKTNINPTKKPYIFLDEIQLITGWEKWVRKLRDLETAHIFVSGSSSKLLSREFGTTLTGRHISFTIFPLNFKEYITFKGENLPKNISELIEKKIIFKKLLNSYLIEGGFPEVIITNNKDLLKNYFEDIIYKDIVLRHQIRDVKSLRNLANFCLTNISNLITYNSLKNNFKISLDSTRDYLYYMEEAFLIFQIPKFSYSLKEQEINPKKIYCIDNGLRNAVSFKFSKDEGKLAENLVFIELKRRNKDIYYWKDKNEVDIVLKNKNQKITAINISYTDEIEEREIKGLLEFQKNFKNIEELILITKNLEKKENNIKFIPLWKWLLLKEYF